MIIKNEYVDGWKWNPFSMVGEAPASLRFKSNQGDDDDPGFATKEDLDIINANPQLLKAYKAVIAGANKKFQEYAGEKKQLVQTVQSLQQQVGELDGGLQEWENVYLQHKDAIDTAVQGGNRNPNPNPQKGGKPVSDTALEKKYTQLHQAFQQAGRQFETRINQMGRMVSLSMQLNQILRDHPEVDVMKVLEFAEKNKLQDLDDAYNRVYEGDILDRKVEEKLGPRLEEEMTKRLTRVETGSGAIPVGNFELPKELPKTFTDAGKEFLQERAKEMAKP